MVILKKMSIGLLLFVLVLIGCRHAGNVPHILEGKTAVEEGGVLFRVPNAQVEAGQGRQILAYKDDFILFGPVSDGAGGYTTKLTILNGKTGCVIAEADCAEWNMSEIEVQDDAIVLSNRERGAAKILDKNLKVRNEYQFREARGSIYTGKNGKTLYCFTAEDGIHVADVRTGEEMVLLRGEAVHLYPSEKCGNFLSFRYTDLDTQLSVLAVIDLATAKVETLPFAGAFYGAEKSGELWLAQLYGEEGVYYIGRRGSPKTFTLEKAHARASLLANHDAILVSEYGKKGVSMLSLYDMDGRFLSACAVGLGGSLNGEPVWSSKDEGYYFTMTVEPGKDILLFWDVSIPTEGDALRFPAAEQKADVGAVSLTLYEKASKISEKYGVEILIAEQVEPDVGDWKIEQIYDEARILEAIGELDDALAAYPDGFMAELRYGTQIKTQILLGGTVTDTSIPPGSAGFLTYIGFANEYAGRNVVGLDIRAPGSLAQCLHHEIMHLIEYKLSFDAKIRKNALYSEKAWEALNPTGFSYPNRRYDLPPEIYEAGYAAYFIDMYARTSAREDRARIMEYAMVGADAQFSSFPARTEKLRYIADCIRDGFDTAGWPEETVWEKTLNRCL